MMEWQPIETAPKDGTVIITVCTYDDPPSYEMNYWYVSTHPDYVEIGDGIYRKDIKTYGGFWSNNGHRASHWMPLPAPPEPDNA